MSPSSCWPDRPRPWSAQAPEYGKALADKLHFFDRPFQSLNELQTALGINTSDKAFDFNPSSLITGFLTFVTPAALQFVLQAVMFFATLVFRHHGPQRFSQIRGAMVRHARVPFARAENTQRHRGKPRRLPDCRDGDQSLARHCHGAHGLGPGPALAADLGRARLRAELHSLCRAGGHGRAAVRRSGL